jgi:hypothetical protein
MAENPQKEYWKRTWVNAINNMPAKLKKNGEKMHYGERATLMRCLGLDMSRSNPKHINYKDYPVLWYGFQHGIPPKDPEVRRKLEICASPNGRIMAWMKLKELGLADKYEKP